MALKKLTDLNAHQLRKLVGTTFSVSEKLDMVYFKLKFNSTGVVPLKVPAFNPVEEIDIIANDIYFDISSFAKDVMKGCYDEIYDMYGDVSIGFFYLPKHVTKVINYYTMSEKTFIVSDWSKKEDIPSCIYQYAKPRPIIGDCVISDDIVHMIEDNFPNVDIVNAITKSSYTGLPLSEIEGIVLNSDKGLYQVVINDTDKCVDKFSTKIYRDTLLNDFSNVILTDDGVISGINSISGYIDKICYLFEEFMSRTDLFNRMHIESNDLLPPHNGYIGGVTVSMIPDSTAQLICKYDERACNVFRILLYTFRKELTDKQFQDFKKESADRLIKLSKDLNNF